MAIEKFRTGGGREPFSEWIDGLEETVQAKIYAYVVRLEAGAARKNVKPLGGGLFELKVDAGPGYRVYFARMEGPTILLLVGGDKGSQRRDIRTATRYLEEYREKNQEL